jgi:hypothetical protein
MRKSRPAFAPAPDDGRSPERVGERLPSARSGPDGTCGGRGHSPSFVARRAAFCRPVAFRVRKADTSGRHATIPASWSSHRAASDGIQKPRSVRAGPGAERAARARARGGRSAPGDGGDPPARARARRAGAALREGEGLSLPAVSNLFGTLERSRYLFRDTLERVQALVELKYDPVRLIRHPFRYLSVAPTAAAALPQRRPGGRSATGPPASRASADRHWPTTAALHHPAAGLHRGRGAPRRDEREPGHVPGADGRQRLRAGHGGGAALPDPPGHRGAPGQGEPGGRAAAGEHLRRRAAGPHAGRGDAAPRGASRSGVRRRARQPQPSATSATRTASASRPTPTS